MWRQGASGGVGAATGEALCGGGGGGAAAAWIGMKVFLARLGAWNKKMAIKGRMSRRMMMMTHKQTTAIMSMMTTQNTNTNINANAPVAATTTTTTGRMLEFTPRQNAL